MCNKITIITVSYEEEGQKLLSFLKRRLSMDIPLSLLHKLIRKGYVNVNNKKCTPFKRLNCADQIKIPALLSDKITLPSKQDYFLNQQNSQAKFKEHYLKIIFENNDYLIIFKPSGLATQLGTKVNDSVTERLKFLYSNKTFLPTPAHRLDKNTGGLLLIAKTYSVLRQAQENFKNNKITKYYLAWVQGLWPHTETIVLEDQLAKIQHENKELVRVNTNGEGKLALSCVTPLNYTANYSLLLIKLLTGRTHQIRVQLSSRGFPIVGDCKYGVLSSKQGMLLHAYQLSLADRQTFTVKPYWTGEFEINEKNCKNRLQNLQENQLTSIKC